MRVLPKGYTLENLNSGEVDKIVGFQQTQGFTDGWNKDMFLGSFSSQNFFCLGIKKGDELKGFISVTVSVDTADIEDILIDKDSRKQGFASLLLEQALNVLRTVKKESVFLEVRESNISAINLYESFGFKQISIRKGYYNGIENAKIFKKELI